MKSSLLDYPLYTCHSTGYLKFFWLLLIPTTSRSSVFDRPSVSLNPALSHTKENPRVLSVWCALHKRHYRCLDIYWRAVLCFLVGGEDPPRQTSRNPSQFMATPCVNPRTKVELSPFFPFCVFLLRLVSQILIDVSVGSAWRVQSVKCSLGVSKGIRWEKGVSVVVKSTKDFSRKSLWPLRLNQVFSNPSKKKKKWIPHHNPLYTFLKRYSYKSIYLSADFQSDALIQDFRVIVEDEISIFSSAEFRKPPLIAITTEI